MLGYAWFVSNTAVTATGLSVAAKSNETFLLISQDKTTATEIQTQGNITTAFTITDDKLFPSKPWANSDSTTYTNVSTANAVTTQATAAAAGNWITANSNNPAVAVSGTHGDKALDSFDGYVIKKTVYLTLAKGSDDANNLTVTPTIAKKAGSAETSVIDAVKVLVVTNDDNIVTLSSTDSGTAKSLHTVSNTDLTDSSVVTVDIYVYYDGSVSSVTTNNAANLAGADISLKFDVEVKSA